MLRGDEVLRRDEGVALEGRSDARRPTNLSVRPDLLAAARRLGINLSGLLERALTEELARLNRDHWRAENAGAIKAYNDNLGLCGTFSTARRIL